MKIFKGVLVAALFASLVGCSDDDDFNKTKTMNDACTKMVQCEGQLGHIASDAKVVEENISGCNQVIDRNFFANKKCEAKAGDYLDCIMGMTCGDELSRVFQSEGKTVPVACKTQYDSFTACLNDHPTVYTCETEDCYCIQHEETCKWITDNSCEC